MLSKKEKKDLVENILPIYLDKGKVGMRFYQETNCLSPMIPPEQITLLKSGVEVTEIIRLGEPRKRKSCAVSDPASKTSRKKSTPRGKKKLRGVS